MSVINDPNDDVINDVHELQAKVIELSERVISLEKKMTRIETVARQEGLALEHAEAEADTCSIN